MPAASHLRNQRWRPAPPCRASCCRSSRRASPTATPPSRWAPSAALCRPQQQPIQTNLHGVRFVGGRTLWSMMHSDRYAQKERREISTSPHAPPTTFRAGLLLHALFYGWQEDLQLPAAIHLLCRQHQADGHQVGCISCIHCIGLGESQSSTAAATACCAVIQARPHVLLVCSPLRSAQLLLRQY